MDLIHSPSGHKRPFAYLQYMEQPPSVQIMKTIYSEPGACLYLYPGFHPSRFVVYPCSLDMKSAHEQLPIMLIHESWHSLSCCRSHGLSSGCSSGGLSSVHLGIGVHSFIASLKYTHYLPQLIVSTACIVMWLHVRMAHGGQGDPFS